MSDPPTRLPTRPLPRIDLPCPPIVWRVTGATIDPGVLDRCLRAGADWFIADCDATDVRSAQGQWIVGIDAGAAASMNIQDTAERFRSRFDRVIGVLLQHADSGQIKAGRAVDRIMRLRDPLGARLLAIDAADTPIAEWLVDHSPAHAVVLPYGLSDQSAGWRLLDAASELGVSLFAHPGKPSTRWIDPDPSAESDLSFIASNPRIACAVIELPVSPDALDALLAAAFRPMSADESGQWIARYRARHAAPARRRHGHAPDEV